VHVTQKELKPLMERVQKDPYFKGVYENCLVHEIYYNQINPKHKRNKFCLDKFMTIPTVFYAKKDFYLMKTLNEKISMLKSSGLINYWNFKDVDERMLKFKEPNYPKVLKIGQVKEAFYILLYGCLVSLMVFLVKNLLFKFKSLMLKCAVLFSFH
jgi:hypothetical protein